MLFHLKSLKGLGPELQFLRFHPKVRFKRLLYRAPMTLWMPVNPIRPYTLESWIDILLIILEILLNPKLVSKVSMGTTEVGLPGFFFYMPDLLRLSTNLDISNPFGFEFSSLGCHVMLSLRIGSW